MYTSTWASLKFVFFYPLSMQLGTLWWKWWRWPSLIKIITALCSEEKEWSSFPQDSNGARVALFFHSHCCAVPFTSIQGYMEVHEMDNQRSLRFESKQEEVWWLTPEVTHENCKKKQKKTSFSLFQCTPVTLMGMCKGAHENLSWNDSVLTDLTPNVRSHKDTQTRPSTFPSVNPACGNKRVNVTAPSFFHQLVLLTNIRKRPITLGQLCLFFPCFVIGSVAARWPPSSVSPSPLDL